LNNYTYKELSESYSMSETRRMIERAGITNEEFRCRFPRVCIKGLRSQAVPESVEKLLKNTLGRSVEAMINSLGNLTKTEIDKAVKYLAKYHNNYMFSQRTKRGYGYGCEYVRITTANEFYDMYWNSGTKGVAVALAGSQFIVPFDKIKEGVELHLENRDEVIFNNKIKSENRIIERVGKKVLEFEKLADKTQSRQQIVRNDFKVNDATLYFVKCKYTNGRKTFPYVRASEWVLIDDELIEPYEGISFKQHINDLMSGIVDIQWSQQELSLKNVNIAFNLQRVKELKERAFNALERLFNASKEYIQLMIDLDELKRDNMTFLLYGRGEEDE
tara:strand:+ start:393 stop:1385 length:993 start_codon:yes stop_codon:yes gene_type:complete